MPADAKAALERQGMTLSVYLGQTAASKPEDRASPPLPRAILSMKPSGGEGSAFSARSSSRHARSAFGLWIGSAELTTKGGGTTAFTAGGALVADAFGAGRSWRAPAGHPPMNNTQVTLSIPSNAARRGTGDAFFTFFASPVSRST